MCRLPSALRPVAPLAAFLLTVSIAGAASAEASLSASLSKLEPRIAEARALSFPQPTPAREVYRAWGETFGVEVMFDHDLKPRALAVDTGRVAAGESLERIARAAGHFAVALDGSTVLVADDTPQNRRRYERQSMRVLPLENLELGEAMTALRSLLALKHVAGNEALQALVVRDSVELVDAAAALLERIDRPRAEVAIAIELLYLDPAGALPQRLAAAERESVLGDARTVSSPRLGVFDGKRGHWTLRDDFALQTANGELTYLPVGLELEVATRVHPGSGEVTLEVEVSVKDGRAANAGSEPVVSTRSVRTSARLAGGETLLVTGLWQGGDGAADSRLAARLGLPDGPGEMVLALTPRIVRAPELGTGDLALVSSRNDQRGAEKRSRS